MSLQEMCTGSATVVPAALRGYRTWRLAPDGALLSTAMPHDWRTGLQAAECRALAGSQHADPPPSSSCGCGLYGWYEPRDRRMVNAPVFGAIEVSGRVLLGTHGFRAERARVLGVVVSPDVRRLRGAKELVARLRDDLVPVYETESEMLTALPPDDVSSLVDHQCDVTCDREYLAAYMTGQLTALASRHLVSASAAYATRPPEPPPPPRWKRYGALAASVVFLAMTAYSSVAMLAHILTRDDPWTLDALRLALLPLNLWGAAWLWPRALLRAWRWGR